MEYRHKNMGICIYMYMSSDMNRIFRNIGAHVQTVVPSETGHAHRPQVCSLLDLVMCLITECSCTQSSFSCGVNGIWL